MPGGPPRSKREVAAAYLRAAHAYMLISMPTGTSTIFGVFQAILALLVGPDAFPPSGDKLIGNGKFASEIFLPQNLRFSCCDAKEFTGMCGGVSNQRRINGLIVVFDNSQACSGSTSSGEIQIKNL